MKTYTEILDVLNANDIKYSRWYAIDNFFYIAFSYSIVYNHDLINRLKAIFVGIDTFALYNTVCIDMNLQPDIEGKKPYDKKTKKELFTLE